MEFRPPLVPWPWHPGRASLASAVGHAHTCSHMHTRTSATAGAMPASPTSDDAASTSSTPEIHRSLANARMGSSSVSAGYEAYRVKTGWIPSVCAPPHIHSRTSTARPGGSPATMRIRELSAPTRTQPITVVVCNPSDASGQRVYLRLVAQEIDFASLPQPVGGVWVAVPPSRTGPVGLVAEDCVPDLVSSREGTAAAIPVERAMRLVLRMQEKRRATFERESSELRARCISDADRRDIISRNRARVSLAVMGAAALRAAPRAKAYRTTPTAQPPSWYQPPDGRASPTPADEADEARLCQQHSDARIDALASHWCRRCFQYGCIQHSTPLQTSEAAPQKRARDGPTERRVWPKPFRTAHVERLLERMLRLGTIAPKKAKVLDGDALQAWNPEAHRGPHTSDRSIAPTEPATRANGSPAASEHGTWLARKCWSVAAAAACYPVIAILRLLEDMPKSLGILATLPAESLWTCLHEGLRRHALVTVGRERGHSENATEALAVKAANLALWLFHRSGARSTLTLDVEGFLQHAAPVDDEAVMVSRPRAAVWPLLCGSAWQLLEGNVPLPSMRADGRIAICLPRVRQGLSSSLIPVSTPPRSAEVMPLPGTSNGHLAMRACLPGSKPAHALHNRGRRTANDEDSSDTDSSSSGGSPGYGRDWRYLSGYPLTTVAPSRKDRKVQNEEEGVSISPMLAQRDSPSPEPIISAKALQRVLGNQLETACKHDGPCTAATCMCVALGVACERFCACDSSCEYKFLGCACRARVRRVCQDTSTKVGKRGRPRSARQQCLVETPQTRKRKRLHRQPARSRPRSSASDDSSAERDDEDSTSESDSCLDDEGGATPASAGTSSSLNVVKRSSTGIVPLEPAGSMRGSRCCVSGSCLCHFAGAECDVDVCSCGGDGGLRPWVPDTELHCTSVQSYFARVGDRQEKVQTARAHPLRARGCCNSDVQRGSHMRSAVARSATHGWGIYAVGPGRADALTPHAKHMAAAVPGEFIFRYAGERITQAEADHRGVLYDAQHMSYLFNLNMLAVLDALRFGNKSKFVNHRPAADSNVEVTIVDVAGEPHIAMRALKLLRHGDELFFDYNYGSAHGHAIARRTTA